MWSEGRYPQFMSDFGNLNDRDQRQLVNDIWAFVTDAKGVREEAAERRHRELIGRIDTIVGAVAIGMRALADALDNNRRR